MGIKYFWQIHHDLVREGIQNKLHRMPENAQIKLQDTLQRIVNEGKVEAYLHHNLIERHRGKTRGRFWCVSLKRQTRPRL